MVIKLGTHKRIKIVKSFFSKWLAPFADIIRNLEYTLVFTKMPLTFQTNLKRVTKNFSFSESLFDYNQLIYNGYLVIISTKVLIKTKLSNIFQNFKNECFH